MEAKVSTDATMLPNRYVGQVKAVFLINKEKEVADLTEHFLTCNLYEDLLGNTVSGNMTLKDTSNYIKSLNLNGADRLVLIVGGNADVVPLEFLAYSHTYAKLNDTSEVVYFNFVSLPFVISQNSRLWGAYRGSISDIAKQVFDGVVDGYSPTAVEDYNFDVPSIECDTTEGVIKAVSPGWTPFEMLAWLSGRATNVETSGSMFLFYQTIFDGYKFKCVEKLVKDGNLDELPDTHIYYYGYAGAGFERNNIKSISFGTLGDSMKGIGELYNDLWITDFTNKTIKKRTFNANTSSSALLNARVTGLLNAENGFGYDFEALRQSGNLRAARKNESTLVHDSIDFHTGNSLQRKFGMLRQAQSMSATFEAFNNTELKVGDIIELRLPQRRGIDPNDTKDDILDKETSGRYIVSARSIQFEIEKVKMQVQCIKDSALE